MVDVFFYRDIQTEDGIVMILENETERSYKVTINFTSGH